jgi:serine/threonine protein kinase/predicted transcriptional regulator
VTRALNEAGIRATQNVRRVGDYVLEELLWNGPYYQDWKARHVNSEKVRRRVRIYSVAATSGAAAREQLERAARRELEALEPLSHLGLLKPQQLTQHELGPALVFDYDPKALRLDHFLVQAGPRLSFEDRLALIRQIAETLQYVHDKRLFHRALSPQSIQVWNPTSSPPWLRILDWQTAVHEAATSRSGAGLTGTTHLDPLVDEATRVYLAPEALTVPDASPESLDVFSLGALAYLVFSGRPPASSVLELHDRLASGKGLQLAEVLDGAPDDLRDLVQLATHPVVAKRVASVAEFLGYLDMVEEALTRPAEEPVADPLAARTGDLLPGGFRVKKRLGKGSTAIVFLVDRDGKEHVLKLGLDPDADRRLRAEAEVLEKLDHPTIVKFLDRVTVGERFGLLLAGAGDKTVAQRLREEGRFQLELLERFGEDLLQAVKYLERQGVPHRDLKPDNLGVATVGRSSERHLVLFDFSLSGTSADNLFAGTKPYLDPFLRERKPPRWDLQAERFAAGVTLYEMATGALPRWGDGQSAPSMLDEGEEVKVEAELLDAAVRAPLAELFARALRRDPRRRFDNAEEMLAAWKAAFAAAGRPATATHEEASTGELALACGRADLDTSVHLLHLSTRAVNALERSQVVIVRDLLKIPLARVHRMRGVGSKTRKELTEAIELLRERLGRPAATTEEPPLPPGETELQPSVQSLDLLVQQILPPAKSVGSERRALLALFGLVEEAPRHPAHWPSQTEVAEVLDLTRARVSQILGKARQRWARLPSITALRDEIAAQLQEQGGAMTARELYTTLLATHGSVQEEPFRTYHAAAALRAATEVEESRKNPRWLIRRSADRIFFALVEVDGEGLLDYVEALGRKADELARLDPLPAPQRTFEVLQSVSRPVPAAPLSPERLLRLATAASRTAVLSSRLEIYPRDLAPERALRLASSSLLGVRELTVEQIHDRVALRFPEAARLPGRPHLDPLLLDVGLGLVWNPAAEVYCFPAEPSMSTGSTSTLHSGRVTLPPGVELPPEEVDARLFDDRLARAAREGAFLTLLVEPRSLLRAEALLVGRFPVELVSLEKRWVAALQELAQENEMEWDFVLRADAEPADRQNAQKLRRFAAQALQRVEADLASSERTILLSRPGLLAHYQQMPFVERLRERVHRRPGRGETGLHGLWLLVPTDRPSDGPQLDGVPVPVVASSQRAIVPQAWLQIHGRRAPQAEAIVLQESS